jgi:hypothetical protein
LRDEGFERLLPPAQAIEFWGDVPNRSAMVRRIGRRVRENRYSPDNARLAEECGVMDGPLDKMKNEVV